MPAKRNAVYKVTRLDNCQSSGHGLGDQRLNMLHHDCGAPEGHERLPRVMDSELRMLREVRSALEARSIKELLTYRRVSRPRYQVVPGQPPGVRSQSPGQVPGHWLASPHAALMPSNRSESAAVATWALRRTMKRRTAPPIEDAACIRELGHARLRKEQNQSKSAALH